MKINILIRKLKSKVGQLSKKLVLQNLIYVSGVTFLISLLGFFKEAFVAAEYGLSISLDTFFVAILVPGLINTVFLGSYKSVFIPNYINEMHIKGNIRGFQSTGLALTFLISLVFIILAFLSTDTYLEVLFPNKSLEYYSLVKKQLYILLPAITFWGISSILGSLLYVNDEYRLSSFAGIFTPITIIICILFFKSYFPETLLAWGTTIGAIATFIYLFIVTYRKGIISLGKIDLNNHNIRIIFQQLPAKISSSLLNSSNSVVDQYFAAQLIIGSIAALNYGLKIPAFLAGLLLVAFSNVLLPYFTKSFLSNRQKSFEVLFKYIKWVFLALIIPVIIGIALSDFIVELLFQRRAFSKSDSEIVALVQKIFLVYLPFKIVGAMMVNFATSINKNNIMAYYSFAAVFLNAILDYLLMKKYGIFGIALSTTIIIILKTVGMYIYLRILKDKESFAT